MLSKFGTALRPTLTVDVPEIGPGGYQALLSSGHRCRYTEVRPQYGSSYAPTPLQEL